MEAVLSLRDAIERCSLEIDAVSALTEQIGESDEILDIIDDALGTKQDELFKRSLVLALASGRRIDISIVVKGLNLLYSINIVIWCAVRCCGDVMRGIVEMSSHRSLDTSCRSLLLFAAGLYHGDHGEGDLPSEFVAEARKLARDCKYPFSGEDLLLCLANKFGLNDITMILSGLPHYSRIPDHGHGPEFVDATLDAPASQILSMESMSVEAPQLTIRRAVERVGRNEPCPCGSGKKYKKCCYDSDQQRLRRSSDIPGVTIDELQSRKEEFLTPERLLPMSSDELAALDFKKINPDLLGMVSHQLCLSGQIEAAVRFLEEVGANPRLHYAWTDTLCILLHAGKVDELKRIHLLWPEKDTFDHEEFPVGIRLALLEDSRKTGLEVLEKAAVRALSDESQPASAGIVTALLSLYPGLGILVGRALIPSLDVYNSGVLLEALLRSRDSLGLSPTDPVEELAELSWGRSFKQEIENERLAAAEAQLDSERQRVERLHRALQQATSQLHDERSNHKQAPQAPARQPDTSETPLTEGKTERERLLETQIESLKTEIKVRNTERVKMREQLRCAQEECKRMPGPAADLRSDELADDAADDQNLDSSVTHRPRTAKYNRKFLDSLDILPRSIRDSCLRTAGRLCAGDSAAFRGTVRLKHDRDLLRQKIGIHYRLLFSMTDSELTFCDIVKRESLDTAIKSLK